MKVTLIVDVPDKRGNGDWYVIGDNLRIVYDDYGSLKNYKDIDDDIAELKPLPNFKYMSLKDEHDDLTFQMGWNACLDEILGEEE